MAKGDKVKKHILCNNNNSILINVEFNIKHRK